MWTWKNLEGIITQMPVVWVTYRIELKLFSRAVSELGLFMYLFCLSYSWLQQPQLNYSPKAPPNLKM